MKVEITQPGVHDNKGKEIEIGTQIDVKGDDVPGWLLNKCTVIGKAPKDGKAVVNTEPSAQERQARMKELVVGLDKEKDFTKEGAPEINALNALLNQDEKPFTAAERDQLWPGISNG